MRTDLYRASAASTLLLTIAICAAQAAPHAKPVKPKPDDKQQILLGQHLFLQTCSPCHGAHGEGDEGPSLQNLPLDRVAFESIVQHGFPGQMPPFAKRFPQAELDQLSAFVHTLKK